MSSRLDCIETVLEGWCDADWMPTWKDDKFIPQLLALVNVAKAAEEAKDYVQCVLEAPYCGDCPACRFREALAVLDKEPA